LLFILCDALLVFAAIVVDVINSEDALLVVADVVEIIVVDVVDTGDALLLLQLLW
jgi:hypothetical protein